MMVHWFCRWEDDGTAPALQAREACRLGIDAWVFELAWTPGTPMGIPEAMQWLVAQEHPPLGFGLQWRPTRPISPADERLAMQALLPWVQKPAALLPLGRAMVVLAGLDLLSSIRWGLPRLRQSLVQASKTTGQPQPLLLARNGPWDATASDAVDGILARSNPETCCQRVCGRWNYESYLAQAHWHRPTEQAEQVSVKPLRDDEEAEYFQASAKAYQDWLRQSQARTSLASLDKPGRNWILLESWRGHQRWAPGGEELGKRRGYNQPGATAPQVTTGRADRAQTQLWRWGAPRRENPALLMHGFHPEILSTVLNQLPRSVQQNWTLYLSTSFENLPVVRKLVEEHHQWAQGIGIGCENKGRDMGPFLSGLLPEALDVGHPWALKLHTKQSSHLNDGAAWSRKLLLSLTSSHALDELARLFHQDQRLGLVAPPGCLLPVGVHLDRNAQWLQTVAQAHRLDGEWLLGQLFPAGSMYAFRLQALEPLLHWTTNIPSMEIELGQKDGTWAHAMERLVGASCLQAGLNLAEMKGQRQGIPHFAYRQALPGNHPWG
jgi:hypothetical protein